MFAQTTTHQRLRSSLAAAGTTSSTRSSSDANARRMNKKRTTIIRAGAAVMDDTGEVTIRRRPPAGHKEHLGMGSERFAFKMEAVTPTGERVDNEENKPRNILEEIVWYKDYELNLMKEKMPLSLVKGQVKLAPEVLDFKQAIVDQMASTGQPGLIAEVKKASPSKGVIQPNFDPVKIAQAYEEGGAACLSVLTDEKFFQGGFENLKLIKAAGVKCPLLCKEFIVDAYQIYLARARGADAILLIAAVLDNQDLKYFTKIAHSVGMKVLLEVHTYGEMKRVLSGDFDIDLLGINNRDLGTFKVDLNVTVELMATELGKEVKERNIVMVGESGIFTIDDVNVVQNAGCGAILVGESLVKQDTPDVGIKKLFGRPL